MAPDVDVSIASRLPRIMNQIAQCLLQTLNRTGVGRKHPKIKGGFPQYNFSMPRFVILRHETPSGHERGPHFDLMLEAGGVLRTWSLLELPAEGKVIQGEALPDHRLAYLDYQGPVSGDRGSVSRVDEGEYEIIEDSADLLRMRFSGKALRGTFVLRRVEGSSSAWLISS